jgi:hypothetical protein
VAKDLATPGSVPSCTPAPAPSKAHIACILSKLDARDCAQLIVLVSEATLVRPGETSPAYLVRDGCTRLGVESMRS